MSNMIGTNRNICSYTSSSDDDPCIGMACSQTTGSTLNTDDATDQTKNSNGITMNTILISRATVIVNKIVLIDSCLFC